METGRNEKDVRGTAEERGQHKGIRKERTRENMLKIAAVGSDDKRTTRQILKMNRPKYEYRESIFLSHSCEMSSTYLQIKINWEIL